ncbi:hypothetical protein K440DRAFT_619778 [Wilcoxina mikolae CBS 423.85]|nr:hypothetical protein K440DRAFT_619778 [Wilcoxina mikolae CBS 423.85]
MRTGGGGRRPVFGEKTNKRGFMVYGKSFALGLLAIPSWVSSFCSDVDAEVRSRFET